MKRGGGRVGTQNTACTGGFAPGIALPTPPVATGHCFLINPTAVNAGMVWLVWGWMARKGGGMGVKGGDGAHLRHRFSLSLPRLD